MSISVVMTRDRLRAEASITARAGIDGSVWLGTRKEPSAAVPPSPSAALEKLRVDRDFQNAPAYSAEQLEYFVRSPEVGITTWLVGALTSRLPFSIDS